MTSLPTRTRVSAHLPPDSGGRNCAGVDEESESTNPRLQALNPVGVKVVEDRRWSLDFCRQLRALQTRWHQVPVTYVLAPLATRSALWPLDEFASGKWLLGNRRVQSAIASVITQTAHVPHLLTLGVPLSTGI